MRAVVQRVLQASVTIDGKVAGEIAGPGLLVLLGVTHDDGPGQVAWTARKIWDLRILREEGLLEFRRGRGITVAGTPERGAVLAQLRNLLEFAHRQGYGRTEIIQMITDLPQDM